MGRKVAIYCRVSTLDQTINNQLLELRDHCSKMEWEITKEYADEGLSGTLSREKRPALNALIKDAYWKRFDSIATTSGRMTLSTTEPMTERSSGR